MYRWVISYEIEGFKSVQSLLAANETDAAAKFLADEDYTGARVLNIRKLHRIR